MGFKEILGKVAPFLGAAIGGPFGAAAGKLLGNFLLGDEDASEADMEKALSGASPTQLAELKKIDADYKVQMAKIGLDEQVLAATDREGARNREIKLGDNMPAILAIMLSMGFFGVLGTILFHPLPREVQGVIDIMLGSLGTAWIATINYYFGSSAGSRLKTLIMKKT